MNWVPEGELGCFDEFTPLAAQRPPTKFNVWGARFRPGQGPAITCASSKTTWSSA